MMDIPLTARSGAEAHEESELGDNENQERMRKALKRASRSLLGATR